MATADRWEEIIVGEWFYESISLPVPLNWPPFPEGDEKITIFKNMLANPEIWGVYEAVVWETPDWLEKHRMYRQAMLPEEEEEKRRDIVKYIEALKWVTSVEIIWYEVEGVRVMFWLGWVDFSLIAVLCPFVPIVQVIPFLPLGSAVDPSPDVHFFPSASGGGAFTYGRKRNPCNGFR